MLTANLVGHLLREAHFIKLQAHLLKRNLVAPTRIVITISFVIDSAKRMLRKQALEQRRGKDEPGQALIRYVQLNRHCSEEVAYQRLAAFVKSRIPPDDQSLIESLLAHERQRLLAIVQDFLLHDPDAINEI